MGGETELACAPQNSVKKVRFPAQVGHFCFLALSKELSYCFNSQNKASLASGAVKKHQLNLTRVAVISV